MVKVKRTRGKTYMIYKPQKTTDWTKRTSLTTGVDLSCSGRASSACSTSGTCRVTKVGTVFPNLMISIIGYYSWEDPPRPFLSYQDVLFNYVDMISTVTVWAIQISHLVYSAWPIDCCWKSREQFFQPYLHGVNKLVVDEMMVLRASDLYYNSTSSSLKQQSVYIHSEK